MPREYINPPELFKHPGYTRIVKVKNPTTMIFFAGLTPADEKYQPVHPGDLRGQYIAVVEGLTLALKAAGASWDDVVFKRTYVLDVDAFLAMLKDPTLPAPWDRTRPAPSTLLGVTRLSNPGFLLEIEIVAALSD
jgi:enamine deaminase RidA (YjgF/YER057c/UK114 family)